METLKFTHFKRAWYAATVPLEPNVVDSISIMSDTAELTINWIDLGREVCPKIEAFNDAWSLLFSHPELLEALSDRTNKRPTPEQICEVLISLGHSDVTKTEQ